VADEGAPSGPVKVQPHGEDNTPDFARIAAMALGGLLALGGLRRIPLSGLALAASGVALIYRGLSDHRFENRGRDTDAAASRMPADFEQIALSLTVARPRETVYAAWRAFEDWPRFMRHLKSVTPLDRRRYHWVASGPVPLEWDAELIEDRASELIAWQSLPGAVVHHSGWASFRNTPDGGGTELYVELRYGPARGERSAAVLRAFTPAARKSIAADIRRFQEYVEQSASPAAGARAQ
jgi:uncharacterized membrane protein